MQSSDLLDTPHFSSVRPASSSPSLNHFYRSAPLSIDSVGYPVKPYNGPAGFNSREQFGEFRYVHVEKKAMKHRRRHAEANRGTGPGWKRRAPAGALAGKILVF